MEQYSIIDTDINHNIMYPLPARPSLEGSNARNNTHKAPSYSSHQATLIFISSANVWFNDQAGDKWSEISEL